MYCNCCSSQIVFAGNFDPELMHDWLFVWFPVLKQILRYPTSVVRYLSDKLSGIHEMVNPFTLHALKYQIMVDESTGDSDRKLEIKSGCPEICYRKIHNKEVSIEYILIHCNLSFVPHYYYLCQV